jgi:hypothetical protein
VNPYNGYSGKERLAKFAEYKRLVNRRAIVLVPPCQLCGDTETEITAHSEDYSMPYRWTAPATYLLCRHCHNQIHKRFTAPARWVAFVGHVNSGGIGRTFSKGCSSRALIQGLETLATPSKDSRAWWIQLSTNRRSLTDPLARPRP